MERHSGRRVGLVVVISVAALLGACSSGTTRAAGGVTHKPGYLVYWDQNEEEDFLSMPSGVQGQLLPAWDINGQMCILPDGSGRFVGGVDPTVPSQHDPGGLRPYKQPAIGEELDEPDGAFSGQELYVPGPYKLPGQTIGEDSPAVDGVFNGNSTYTGCVFTKHGDLLASDIGTAQGSFPVPADGRLVEWFAPSYTSYCILAGPTSGGTGPHHVDGTGGLSQPGMLTLTDSGDILLPEAGIGEVLRVDHTSLPAGAAACPGGLYPAGDLRTSVFFHGTASLLPFPDGVARDPTCDCYAISSFFGASVIAWFDDDGKPAAGRSPVPGETIAELGQEPDGYNPFGLAFAPDGTLYFVDIHITCQNNVVGDNCGPADYGGRVMKVSFVDGHPRPAAVVHAGFDFPTSVTICVPAHELCPYPTGRVVAPAFGPAENDAPARGPGSDKPATAGFG